MAHRVGYIGQTIACSYAYKLAVDRNNARWRDKGLRVTVYMYLALKAQNKPRVLLYTVYRSCSY